MVNMTRIQLHLIKICIWLNDIFKKIKSLTSFLQMHSDFRQHRFCNLLLQKPGLIYLVKKQKQPYEHLAVGFLTDKAALEYSGGVRRMYKEYFPSSPLISLFSNQLESRHFWEGLS